MDMRTGRTYATKEEALAAGVPEQVIADLRPVSASELSREPDVRFLTGPFKHRVYKRDPNTRQLVRVS